MPTRSTRLGSSGPAANVATSLLTVPPGQTYLVKSVLASNLGGAGDSAQVWVQDAGGLRGYLMIVAALAANSRTEWDGWVALNPGDQLMVYSFLGTTQYWVSGTKLPGIA